MLAEVPQSKRPQDLGNLRDQNGRSGSNVRNECSHERERSVSRRLTSRERLAEHRDSIPKVIAAMRSATAEKSVLGLGDG